VEAASDFVTSWTFFVMMLFGSGGGVGVPLGVPPLPEDPALAKVAPEECLLYFSSAGMAKPDARSTNRTERLFAEPEVRGAAAEIEKLIRAQLKESVKKQKPEEQALAEDGPTLVRALLTRPLALYVPQVKPAAKGPPEVRAGAVVNLGEDADALGAALQRCVAALAPNKAKEVTIGGATFHQLATGANGPEFTWGVKGKYLFAATGPGEIEALLKRSGDGSAPQWLAALHKQMPVERVSTVGMVNAKALVELLPQFGVAPDVARVLEALGLTSIDRLAGVSGLDKEGFVSRSLVSFRGEPKGLLRLAEQKPLAAADLDLIPRDATFGLAWKLDADKARAVILDVVEKIDPKAKEDLDAELAGPPRELLDGVVKALGDTWCVFDSPGGGGLLVGTTVVVSLKDRDAAAALQKKLLGMVEQIGQGIPDARRRPRVEQLTFGTQTVYVFDGRWREVPLAPSWCLTDKYLAVAPYPEAIKAFLARDKNFAPLTKVPDVGAALGGEGGAVALTYTNTRRLFDLFYPLAPVGFRMLSNELAHDGIDLPPGLLPSAGSIRPHLRPGVTTMRRTTAGIEVVSRQTLPGNSTLSTAPIMVGLLVPAVQKVREAAARIQSGNNLHQILIAMHNHQAVNGTLPPAYNVDKDGKPLLSWRVHILPYIDQDELYKEFHLDEPWDSPHNKKLIEKMPKTYRSPASHAAAGKTNYLTVRGKDMAFPGDKGLKLPADFPDGTSNTIFIVEASDRKAVIWTKPDDYEVNEKNPLEGLVGLWRGMFLAGMGDGSVRVIYRTVDPKQLMNAFIRNDGNPVDLDK
jgi:hypothetical protein